jgi:TIR domain
LITEVDHGAGSQFVPVTTGPIASPKAFITYSWDSPEHRTWVGQLATRLRQNGVDTILDHWDLKPGHDRFAFMESSVADSNFVLVVCTERYAEKANGRTGGVGYEATIITPELAGKVRQTKFVPVLREGDWDNAVPRWLKSRIGFDLRGTEYDEAQYEELVRHLHNATDAPPPVGPRPDFTTERSGSPRNSGDSGKATFSSYVNRDLNPKEIELLWTAAQDTRGEILYSKTLDGEGLRTNGRHFLNNADARSAMEWLGALRGLEDLGFIEPLSQARDFFRLTGQGYEAADRLEGFRRWSADTVVLRAHYFNASPSEHVVSCKGVIALPPTYFDSAASGDAGGMRSLKEPRTVFVEGVDVAPQLDWSPNEVEFVDASTGNTHSFRVREMQLRRRCLKLALDQ